MKQGKKINVRLSIYLKCKKKRNILTNEENFEIVKQHFIHGKPEEKKRIALNGYEDKTFLAH